MSHPLEAATPVVLDDRAPWFETMVERWPDRATAQHFLYAVHRREVARAGKPPVINVVMPGVPGHFTGTADGREAAYVPGPSLVLTGAFSVVPD